MRTDLTYLARGGTWLVVGQIGTAIIALATAIAFARLAAPDTYGNYKYVLALAGLFSAFSLSGIGTAVIQSVARGYEGSLRQGFHLSLKWSWGVVLISVICAGYYSLIEHNAFLGASLLIVALLLPFLNSFSLFDPFLIGKRRFKENVIYTLLNAALPAVAVIASLFFTHRAVYVIAVYFASNALCDYIFYRLTIRRMENLKGDPALLGYSGHLSIMGVVNAVADKIDSIAIFSFLGPVNLAFYTFAIAMPEQLKTFSRLLNPLAMPRFAERSLAEIRVTIWRRIAWFSAGMALIIAAYIAFAPFLFSILFPKYLTAVGYSRWYALSLVVSGPVIVINSIFQAHKNTRALYWNSNAPAILLVLLLPVSAYYFGIAGAIGSQFVYRIVILVITVWQFLKLEEHSHRPSESRA